MRKIVGKLHLWLGLTSGLLVFIIAITGCMYAFQEEIQEWTQPYRRVMVQSDPLLPPSRLQSIAASALPGKHVHALMYEQPGRAAKAIFYSFEEDYYFLVYMDPYSGEVLQVRNENQSFFRFILNGHFYLWLPPAIGQPLVASATLVFLVMLISGLFLWWPRNKAGRKQRFSIKWSNVRWRRRNYDLHNVLGFYILCLALVFAITGLVWGFEWFRNTYYATITAGESFVDYQEPHSVAGVVSNTQLPAIDQVWYRMQEEYPDAAWIEIHPPEDSLSCIAANANPDRTTYWETDFRYFDRYSLQELRVNHLWGRFTELSAPQKLMRMNYDLHVGAVGGLPGKILAFLVSLLVASLPVTGTLIWWGRRVN